MSHITAGLEHLEASFDNNRNYVDEERVGDIVKIKIIIMISIIKNTKIFL